jgi:AcrR family transcriptional regulator
MRPSESLATPSRPDPRIARSEAAIQGALLGQLAAGRHFDSLTVSEIATRAGVTRKTFYARFASLEQVVSRSVEGIFSAIGASIEDRMLTIPLVDNSLAMRVFEGCACHQAVLGPLIRNCPPGLFVDPVSAVAQRLLERAMRVNRASPMHPIEEAYLIAAVASMVHGVVSVWARRGFSEPAERVATFVDTLLADGMQKAVLPNTR